MKTRVDPEQPGVETAPAVEPVWCRDRTGRPIGFSEFTEMARTFHGYPAPGLVLGGPMVELARRGLPAGTLFDAVSETPKCLPDAVQILTPCTAGNGWLKILDLGRYAVILYDKYSGAGRRVFIDPAALDAWPEIRSWFFVLKPKKEQDTGRLMAEIREAGTSILGVRRVRLRPEYLEKRHMSPYAVCPACKEAYPRRQGPACRACAEGAPYLEDAAAGFPDPHSAIPDGGDP